MSGTAAGVATLRRVMQLAIEDEDVSIPDLRPGQRSVKRTYYVLGADGVARTHLLLVSDKYDRRPQRKRRPLEPT